MKRVLALLVCGLLCALALAACGGNDGYNAPMSDADGFEYFYIENNSGVEMAELYMAAEGDEDNGPQLLDAPIAPGATVMANYDPRRGQLYDILLKDAAGNEYWFWDMELKNNITLLLTAGQNGEVAATLA